MDRKRNSLVPIAEVFGGLDGPPNALREASSQAVHHFTRFDQVNPLVGPEAHRMRASRSPSGAMRPLPSRKFMRLRRNAEYSTPFAFRPTRAWSWRSKTSCFGRREGPPGSPWCATRVFAIRRRVGRRRGGSSPRSSITRASCSRGSDSS